MNVLEALIGVIAMQLVTTLVGVTPALATLGTLAMDFLAHVSAAIYNRCAVCWCFFFRIVSLNSGGCYQNGHNTDGSNNLL